MSDANIQQQQRQTLKKRRLLSPTSDAARNLNINRFI